MTNCGRSEAKQLLEIDSQLQERIASLLELIEDKSETLLCLQAERRLVGHNLQELGEALSCIRQRYNTTSREQHINENILQDLEQVRSQLSQEIEKAQSNLANEVEHSSCQAEASIAEMTVKRTQLEREYKFIRDENYKLVSQLEAKVAHTDNLLSEFQCKDQYVSGPITYEWSNLWESRLDQLRHSQANLSEEMSKTCSKLVQVECRLVEAQEEVTEQKSQVEEEKRLLATLRRKSRLHRKELKDAMAAATGTTNSNKPKKKATKTQTLEASKRNLARSKRSVKPSRGTVTQATYAKLAQQRKEDKTKNIPRTNRCVVEHLRSQRTSDLSRQHSTKSAIAPAQVKNSEVMLNSDASKQLPRQNITSGTASVTGFCLASELEKQKQVHSSTFQTPRKVQIASLSNRTANKVAYSRTTNLGNPKELAASFINLSKASGITSNSCNQHESLSSTVGLNNRANFVDFREPTSNCARGICPPNNVVKPQEVTHHHSPNQFQNSSTYSPTFVNMGCRVATGTRPGLDSESKLETLNSAGVSHSSSGKAIGVNELQSITPSVTTKVFMKISGAQDDDLEELHDINLVDRWSKRKQLT